MSEQFYDDEIAPVLMELAQKCEARGMSFLADLRIRTPVRHQPPGRP